MLETVSPKESDERSAMIAHSDELIYNVGLRVRAQRKELGMTRKMLAEASGVSPRYLAQLEAGEGNFSIGLLSRVAMALGVPIDSLFRGQSEMPTAEERLVTLFRAADKATRERAFALLGDTNALRARAHRICLLGLRGAGKSTLGPLIARDLSMPFIELNSEIERVAGMPVGEIFAFYGEDGYRELETETLKRVTANHTSVVLAAAGGIVSNSRTFEQIMSRFHTVWLRAEPDEHMERVRAQGDFRPMAGNPEAMVQLRKILQEREVLYRQADLQMDTSGKTVDQSHSELTALLRTSGIAVAKTD